MGALGGLKSGFSGDGKGVDTNGVFQSTNGALGKGVGNGKGIGGLFGTAGGAGGSGFAAPEGANIQQGVTTDQVQGGQAGVDQSLGGQQALLAALQGQQGLSNQNTAMGGMNTLGGQLAGNNGAGNQASAYDQSQRLAAALNQARGVGAQTSALKQQSGLNTQLANANGVDTQNAAISGLQNIAGHQQELADQYQNVANGTGPNPAQAALNNATSQNVANQAALMAGQRGAGSNVGLMARQAAQQGAATQQQAVGQSAEMQAQQQLAGMQGLAGQQQAMGSTQQAIGGLGSTQAGMQQAGIQNQAAMGSNLTAQQMAQQQALAGQAQNQVQNQLAAHAQQAGQANVMAGQQIAGQQAVTQANLANAGQLQGALGNYNTAQVGSQNNINAGNVGLAQTNMQGQQAMLGGTLSGVGSGMSMMGGGARGGIVEMAEGGEPTLPYPAPTGQGPTMPEPVGEANTPYPAPAGQGPLISQPPPGPSSEFGRYLAGLSGTGSYLEGTTEPPITAASTDLKPAPVDTETPNQPQMGYGSQMLYKGAKDSAKAATMAAMAASRGGLAENGGHVKAKTPDQKATKSGNSYSNDKVPAMLSEHEIVLPRTVTQSADPARSAADFVAKVLAKRRSA